MLIKLTDGTWAIETHFMHAKRRLIKNIFIIGMVVIKKQFRDRKLKANREA